MPLARNASRYFPLDSLNLTIVDLFEFLSKVKLKLLVG
jgi:hypothetical protein